MDLTFFGLTIESAPKFRLNLFTQIHQMVFHGNGGYTFDAVYDMPIWLRNFTYTEMEKWYAEQNQEQQTSMQKSIDNMKKASKYSSITPDSPLPDFITKMDPSKVKYSKG